MMKTTLTLLLCLLLQETTAFAIEVTAIDSTKQYIAIKQEAKKRWNLDDKVCVYKDGKKSVCGQVVKVRDWGVMARLESTEASISKGDAVKRLASRTTSSISEYKVRGKGKGTTLAFGIGSQISSSFLIPSFSLQVLLSRRFALGISPLFTYAGGAEGSAMGYGINLSGNMYFGEDLSGFWLMAGLEYLSLKASLGTFSESASSLGGIVTAGYRFSLSKTVQLGLAVGPQYFTDPKLQVIEAGVQGLHGIGYFDVGFKF